jgi:hypothetical protein
MASSKQQIAILILFTGISLLTLSNDVCNIFAIDGRGRKLFTTVRNVSRAKQKPIRILRREKYKERFWMREIYKEWKSE